MFLSSYHPEIFRSYYHIRTWYPCKRSRSKVKVTEVMTPFSRFRTLIPVWIHIWWWNDAQSLMLLRRGALFFFKVTRQISRSHGLEKSSILTQIGRFRTITPVWIHQWLPNDEKAWSSIGEVPYFLSRSSIKFQGHTALKIVKFYPDWAFPDCNSSLNAPMSTKCCTKLEVA